LFSELLLPLGGLSFFDISDAVTFVPASAVVWSGVPSLELLPIRFQLHFKQLQKLFN